MADKTATGVDGKALAEEFKHIAGTIEMWMGCSVTPEQSDWLDGLRDQVLETMEKFGYILDDDDNITAAPSTSLQEPAEVPRSGGAVRGIGQGGGTGHGRRGAGAGAVHGPAEWRAAGVQAQDQGGLGDEQLVGSASRSAVLRGEGLATRWR